MQDQGSPEAPGLGPFLQIVQDKLVGLSHNELCRLLLESARQLPVDDRPAFLAMLDWTVAPDRAGTEVAQQTDPTLLEDIISFIDELQGGSDELSEYAESDSSREEERGDTAWVEALDELFNRAAQVFLSGGRALAAEAFGHLLRAFGRDEGFTGPDDPEDMVAADLPEAKARYLRALYDVTPMADRASRLIREMAALQWVGARRVTLSNVIDADVAPLPGLEDFLPVWVAALGDAADDGSFGWNRLRRRLIREAVVLEGGLEALGELAQNEGADHFQAYHEWVTRLADEGRLDEATRAAREGTTTIRDAHERARMADCLATFAYRQADWDLLLLARREAWRTSASPRRLAAFACAQKPTFAETIERMAAESKAIEHGELSVDDRLAAQVSMLACNYDGVLARLDRATPRGWRRDAHPSPVVVPYLLIAGSGSTVPRPSSTLAAVWSQLDAIVSATDADEQSILLEYGHVEVSPDEAKARLPLFTDLVTGVLTTQPPTDAQRQTFLSSARGLIERRIRAVVLGKHLQGYEQAAMFLTAWAEAEITAGAAESALAFLQSFKRAYNRFRSFRRELDAITDASPLIADAAANA